MQVRRITGMEETTQSGSGVITNNQIYERRKTTILPQQPTTVHTEHCVAGSSLKCKANLCTQTLHRMSSDGKK